MSHRDRHTPLRLCIALLVAGVSVDTAPLAAQRPTTRATSDTSPPGFSRLRADGNGIAALRTPVTLTLIDVTVTAALNAIAAQTRLNLTFDPRLPGLDAILSLRTTGLPAAEAFLRVTDGRPLAIHVSASGQLVALTGAPQRLTRDTIVTVRGRALDSATGAPIQAAIARVVGSRYSVGAAAVTDSLGAFTLTAAPGRVVVSVRALGYATLERDTLALPGATIDLPFRLEQSALRLDAVRSEGASMQRVLFEEKPNVGAVTITRRELSAAPAFAEPDLLRAVRLMPGVSTRNDYTTGLNVRGGEADQNLILLDGYPIYNPFHFGGLLGTFIDPMVGHVNLLTGAFPARYGGRLSSVLDVRSAEDGRTGVHGSTEVSLVAATTALGGTFANGMGTWMLGGRRTYADQVVNIVHKNGLPYHFQDVHAHATYALPGGVRLATTGYAGLDFLEPAESHGENFSWGNTVLGATLSKAYARPHPFGVTLGDSATIEQRFSVSRFNTELRFQDGGTWYRLGNAVGDRRMAGELTAYGGAHQHTIGYDVARYDVRYEPNLPPLLPAMDTLTQRTMSASLFYDELWRVTPTLLVQGGVRVDVAPGHGAMVGPRLSLKYFATPNLAFTASTGTYAQWMHSLSQEDLPLRLYDFWIASDSSIPVSRARQHTLGVERWLNPSRMFRVEAFYKSYGRLLETFASNDPDIRGDELVPLSGRSYGFDVMVRQLEVGRFNGWISYSYTMNERRQSDGTRFFPAQDRRHDLNIVGGWQLGKYSLGARVGLATGTPYTPIVGMFNRPTYDPATNHWVDTDNDGIPQFLGGTRNGGRLPLTQRLDLSVTRHGKLFGASVSPYLSLVNAYNARNVFSYGYDYSKQPPTRISVPQLPLFPSLGVTIVY